MDELHLIDGDLRIAPFATHTLKPGVGDQRVVRLYYFDSVPSDIRTSQTQITIVIQESPDASLPNPTVKDVYHKLEPVVITEDVLEGNVYLFEARPVVMKEEPVVYVAGSLVPAAVEAGLFSDARVKPAYASKNMELIVYPVGKQPLYTADELKGGGFSESCAAAESVVVVSRRELIE